MKNLTTTIIAITVVLSLTSLAGATVLGTVDIEFDSFGEGGNGKVTGGGLNDATVRAGVYLLEKTGGTGQGNLWDDGLIAAFCIDLAQRVPHEETTYEVVKPQDAPVPQTSVSAKMGVEKAGFLSELFGRYYDASWADSDDHNAEAEAFGAAIWEIVYEDVPTTAAGWDVGSDGTSGAMGFKASGLHTDIANGYLHSLDGTGPMSVLRAFRNCAKQDFITEVPEPATIALLGLGGIGLLRRRRATA